MSLAIDAYQLAAEQRLKEKADSLEKTNAELTELQTSKERLTQMVVHDLQNPLAGVTAFLQVLDKRSDHLDDEERRCVQQALIRCNDVQQLIMNILHLSQAEKGELDVLEANVDLVGLAREATETFLQVAENEGRTLAFVAEEPHIMARTDPALLIRMLHNLIRNALRHTPEGTHVEVEVKPGAHPAIHVSDDGPGIPAAVQQHVFQPGGLRRAGVPVDSGLGLAFCKAAADRLGIRLELTSHEGSGTVFSLRLEPRGVKHLQ
jgi:signal transduction histidine kinase